MKYAFMKIILLDLQVKVLKRLQKKKKKWKF